MTGTKRDRAAYTFEPPFTMPNVRSTAAGNIVHRGVVNRKGRLRAACHADTEIITMASPTGDPVSCSNCHKREVRGQISSKNFPTLPPHLVPTALAIWRQSLPDTSVDLAIFVATATYELGGLCASHGADPDVYERGRILTDLNDDLTVAFAMYEKVDDQPALSELVDDIVKTMIKIVQPQESGSIAA